MDYDPTTQQYRERHNASWDRIRHENASSVRSEPADPSYLFNSFDYNFDPYQEIPVVNNYVPQDHQLLNLDYIPIDHSLLPHQEYNQPPPLQDLQNLQNLQSSQNFQPIQNLQPLDPIIHYEDIEVEPLGLQLEEEELEEELEEEDDDVTDSEASTEEEDAEIDRPDIYCMDCLLKIEDTTRHDLATCLKSKPQKFECNRCEKEFNFEKNLKVHKVLEHTEVNDFISGTICPFCPKDAPSPVKFSRFSAYIGHLKIHAKSDLLRCSDCLQEFHNERQRDHHYRRVHAEDSYELSFCSKCQKVIPLEETATHSLLHISENVVVTGKRGRPSKVPAVKKNVSVAKVQPKKNEVKRRNIHQKKVKEKVRNHACGTCGKAFYRPSELARHNMIHIRAELAAAPDVPNLPMWKCAVCDKEYSHKTGLSEHTKIAHGNAKPILCPICGSSFTKKTNLDRHMLSIHPVDQDPKDRDKYQCPDCPTVFSTRASLTRHKREMHNKTTYLRPGKPVPIYERHICKTCNREFRDNATLKMHQRLHISSEHRFRKLQGGGERKCQFCEQSFVFRASLIWHVQKHYEEQQQDEQAEDPNCPPYCSLCELNFCNLQELRQHQDEQHSVICGVCHQKFSSRQVYEDHICNRRFAKNQMLPSNRVLICRQCRPPQRLTTARQIKEHRARHLPRKTHLCWTCHKSFRTSQLLALHAEVHDRQPIQCTLCPQTLFSRVALKQHMRTVHGGGENNYQCVVHVDRSMAMSAQSFAEYGIAGDHADDRSHRAHSVTEWMDTGIVPQEEEVFVQDEYIPPVVPTIETSTSRSQPRTYQGTGTGADAAIRCEVCHHLYNNIEMLCDHWQSSDTDTDHSYRIITCPICESRIRSASEAANHLRSVHLVARRHKILPIAQPPPPESLALVPLAPTASSITIQPSTAAKKGHQCPECSKVLTRKNDLARHMKIHTGEREHLCPECGQAFREKSTLKNHMQTHSDDPPQIQCTVCQKAFFEKKTLVIHMRIHTGEQPFKCRFCDLHFRTTAMQRTHEKKCAYGGPNRPILPDPSARTDSLFQPQFTVPQVDVNKTIGQISTLPHHELRLHRNSAFSAVGSLEQVATSGDTSIYVITKPITQVQYIVIVQKARPQDGTLREAVDTVSEIKIHQLQESTNLSIVLHNDMRLNLNTVKMLEMISMLRYDSVFKTRVQVGEDTQYMDINDLFTIFAHNKSTTGMEAFIRRCEICEVDLMSKRQSDAHFYSEDHETAQLMCSSKTQLPTMSIDRMPNNMMIMNDPAVDTSSDLNCKLCGSRFMEMNSLLNHIRREHDEPPVQMPPRPAAHTAPIN